MPSRRGMRKVESVSEPEKLEALGSVGCTRHRPALGSSQTAPLRAARVVVKSFRRF
jgi:hypothetical protein